MSATKRSVALVAIAALLAGCDANPEGPRVPPNASTSAAAASGGSPRQPVTKNRREIVNPE